MQDLGSIGVSRASDRRRSGSTVQGYRRRAGDKSATTNAVVPLTTGSPISSQTTVRPHAAFVAQLIATRERDPQTRTVRRASAADATAIYDAAAPVRPGRAVSRTA